VEPFPKTPGVDDELERILLVATLSTMGFTIGGGLLIDDYKDFAQFSREDHPSPLHHWQLGLAIWTLSLVGYAWLASQIAKLLGDKQQGQGGGGSNSSQLNASNDSGSVVGG